MLDHRTTHDKPLAAVLVRPARPADFDAIRRIHRVTFDEHVAREPDFAEPAPFIDPMLQEVASDRASLPRGPFGRRAVVLVAEAATEVAGHLAYTVYCRWWRPYAALIADISIAPGHRRSRIASRLLEEAERLERARGLVAMAATIWPNNAPSLSFFRASGYAPPSGIAPTGDAEILLEKKLKQP